LNCRWPEPSQAEAIDVRIRHLSLGNAGDAKPVSDGVSELTATPSSRRS